MDIANSVEPTMENKEVTEEGIATGGDDLSPVGFPAEYLSILREMMGAGLMYGHKKSKTNPKYRPYIFTTRNGIEIIDLERTLEALDEAVEFLKNKIKDGASLLIVATQPAAREAIRGLAQKFDFSYINDRWVGGLLTNFRVISGRIEYFKKLQADYEKGGFEKYTKKERVVINRSIDRMRQIFTGLEKLTKLPDVIFMIDTTIRGHRTALREARRMKIPVVAIIDSDDDPQSVNYPIPANDHTRMSIDWIINRITDRLSGAQDTDTHEDRLSDAKNANTHE